MTSRMKTKSSRYAALLGTTLLISAASTLVMAQQMPSAGPVVTRDGAPLQPLGSAPPQSPNMATGAPPVILPNSGMPQNPAAMAVPATAPMATSPAVLAPVETSPNRSSGLSEPRIPGPPKFNLSNQDEDTNKMHAQGTTNLDSVTGNKSIISLPLASPVDTKFLDEMQARQRSVGLLTVKNQEAEQAVKLLDTVYNSSFVKNIREDERKVIEAREKAEKEKLDAMIKAKTEQMNARPAANIPRPLSSEGAVVSEVMGNQATILVPGFGTTRIKTGQELPDGSRLVQVNRNGAVIVGKYGRKLLPLGSSTR